MSIEEKLLKLMEGKAEKPEDTTKDPEPDNDGDDKADRVDQEPAVSIENPIDPNLQNSEINTEDPDGDIDEVDQDEPETGTKSKQKINEENLTEEVQLSKKDHDVLAAFAKGEKAESKKLMTDGKTVEGLWIGGKNIASRNEDGKVSFSDIGSRSAQTIQRALKNKHVAKNDLVEAVLDESSFVIDGTEDAKDTIDHGDYTIHHLTKPGHSGASIVARHKDGAEKSVNLYTGNREGADRLMQHPSHLKKIVDIANGKIEEAVEIQDFVKEEELSEEFQLKVSTLFEAKVNEKVSTLVEEKTSLFEETYRVKLEEAVTSYENELTEKIDGYFGSLSEQWIKDNELALEASIRSELTESFMTGMKQLFESHYVDLPVEKFDVVNSLEEQLKVSKDELSAATQLLEEQREKLNKAEREIIIENTTKGMTDIDSGKFRAIMEDFDFESSELFTKRTEIIKESFFGQNKKEVSNLSGKKLDISSKSLIEETQLESKPAITSTVSQYADFIRKTAKQ